MVKKKAFSFLLVIVIIGLIFIYFHFIKREEADYYFVGKFPYKISNERLFRQTYLDVDSYGFLIGNLPIQGISINTETLVSSKDYLFSINRSIKAVYINSPLVKNEGQEHLLKKPVEIIQDYSITDSLFIYVY